MKRNRILIILTVLMAAGGLDRAFAQAIIVSNDLRVTPTSPGSQDYYYVQGQNSPLDTLTDFSLTTLAPEMFNPQTTGSEGFAELTTQNSLTTFETGMAYQGANTGSDPFALATFTADVPNFTVSILEGNTDNKENVSDVQLILLVNGVNVANSILNTSSTSTTSTHDEDEFGQFVIDDASPDDVFTIEAIASGKSKFSNGTYLGGVTFSVGPLIAVPEPSAFSLLALAGFGAVLFSFVRRLRLRKMSLASKLE